MPRPFETAQVSGFIHDAAAATSGLALTHGAGANCTAPLLVVIAEAFAAHGITVLRFDLAFRRKRRFGPPHPSAGEVDRQSIRDAIAALRTEITGPVFAGGHSYGGRQATMLAAEEPDIAQGLLLLSYPLHPPNKPDQLRTAHFRQLRTRAVFVQGNADAFGTPEEMRAALEIIPAPTQLIILERAGHELRKGRFDLEQLIHALTEQH